MEDKFVHTYSLKSMDNQLVLMKDGREVFCHKLMPFPQQNQFGQVALVRIPCQLNCGKANVITDPFDYKKEIFVQSCDGTVNRFPLEMPQEEEKKEGTGTGTGKLISL